MKGDESGRPYHLLIVVPMGAIVLTSCIIPGTSGGPVEHASVARPPSLDEDNTSHSEATPAGPLALRPGEPAAHAPDVAASAPAVGSSQASRTAPVAAKRFSWARSDGRRISGDAELTAQAQADLVDCKADATPRVVTGAGGEACMKRKGYYVRAVE
jgi:hypothetical protein